MKTIQNEYIEMLNGILTNARTLARASRILLSNYLGDKSLDLRPTVQFLLYSCAEECGKFLIVKDLYPNNLSNKLLHEKGFYDHVRKWGKLMRYYSEQTGDLRNQCFYGVTADEAAKFIREKVREPSLYVEFKQGNLIMPGLISDEAFSKLVKVAAEFIKLCRHELNGFKKTPLFHRTNMK